MTFNGSSCPEELSSDVYSGLDEPSQLSGVHAAGESRESSQKRSDMWDHFKKAADYETSKKASCIHCKARLTTYAVVGGWVHQEPVEACQECAPQSTRHPGRCWTRALDKFFGGALPRRISRIAMKTSRRPWSVWLPGSACRLFWLRIVTSCGRIVRMLRLGVVEGELSRVPSSCRGGQRLPGHSSHGSAS